MRKIGLSVLFFGFFGFVSNAFAYNSCDPQAISLPCSVGIYDFTDAVSLDYTELG
jgi:hypothetical protein